MPRPTLSSGWKPIRGGILEDGPLLIIGRQVPTDLGKSIYLFGVDREGNVVVVELKRDRTPRDVVAQALEYDAAALERILGEYHPAEPKGLAAQHREYFDQSEAIAFNKGPAYRDHRPAGVTGDQADGVVPGGQGSPGHLCRVHLLPGRWRWSPTIPGDRRWRERSEAAQDLATVEKRVS